MRQYFSDFFFVMASNIFEQIALGPQPSLENYLMGDFMFRTVVFNVIFFIAHNLKTSFLRRVYYDQWLLRTWLEVEYAVSYTYAHNILLARYAQFPIPSIFLFHMLTRKAGEVSLVTEKLVLD